MKENIGRDFNVKDGKVRVQRFEPSNVLPGAGDLLRIANRLSIQVKRAEDPELWKAKCREQARVLIEQVEREIEQGGKKNIEDLLLRSAQALREAGNINPDVALAHILSAIVHMDKDQTYEIEAADLVLRSKLTEIGKKIHAIQKREGLLEGDKLWNWTDPNKPEDYRALAKESFRYRTATVLRYYGEYEIATLLLNDPATFNLRFKAGLLEMTKDDPDIVLDDEFFEKVSF